MKKNSKKVDPPPLQTEPPTIISSGPPSRRVYLAPRETQREGSGSGTEFDPIRLSFVDNCLREEAEYILAPGVYHTRGAWANDGWDTLPYGSITGPSAGRAVLSLSDPIFRPGVTWTYILHVGRVENEGSLLSARRHVSDLILLEGPSSSESGTAVGGMYVWGNVSISRVQSTARGNYSRDEEVFAFGSNKQHSRTRWEMLRAYVSDYASGFSLGHTSTILRDSVCAGNDGHAGVILASYDSHVDGIHSFGTRYGVYHDYDPLLGGRVTSSRIEASYASVGLIRQRRDDWHQGEIQFVGCDFSTKTYSEDRERILVALLTVEDTSRNVRAAASDWRDVEFQNCRFRADVANPWLLSSHGGLGRPRFIGCSIPVKSRVKGLDPILCNCLRTDETGLNVIS